MKEGYSSGAIFPFKRKERRENSKRLNSKRKEKEEDQNEVTDWSHRMETKVNRNRNRLPKIWRKRKRNSDGKKSKKKKREIVRRGD